MNWLKCIKNIVIQRLAEITKILHAGLILANFFTKRTVVGEPLPDDLDDEFKTNLLTRRNGILSLVKEEIDKVLNPNKPEYDCTKTEEEFLTSLGITEE